MQNSNRYIRNFDIYIMSFIFLLLFLLPLIFTRDQGRIAWPNVIKIWQDRILLVPLFIVNRWLLVPRLVLRKKYTLYLTVSILLITTITLAYYFVDESGKKRPVPVKQEMQGIPPEPGASNLPGNQPEPVPPYADLLLFSLLILAVDTGMSLTGHWRASEDDKVRLEKENIETQLGILRNQISPHFFMNTLNNIYSLIENDKVKAREVVMKLSKLMRYLLYENQSGKVLLSKEFDFIKSYFDLMKLRFVDDVEIRLIIPETFTDVEIPVLLFISYLENAFKFGPSYQQNSIIESKFEIEDDHLLFTCTNTKNIFSEKDINVGIGLQNSKKRLDLIYMNRYSLTIHDTDVKYTVKLKIPLK